MTVHISLPATALALALPVLTSAQTPAPSAAAPSLRTFFADLRDDIERLGSNPGNVSLVTGGIVSASLHPLDDDVAEWQAIDGFAPGTWIGNGAVMAAGTLTTYAVGHWGRVPRLRHVAADLLRAQTLTLGVTYGLKASATRMRPDGSSKDSFPSGHTSESFASATVLARHFGAKAAWPAYGVATFVSVSRMNQGRHFLSDVVFGAGLGIAMGWNATRSIPRPGGTAWRIEPAVSRTGTAVFVTRHVAP